MKKIIIFLVTFLLSSAVFAQSADVITEILDSSKVSYGQVCYLSAVSQGFISEDASYDDAINSLYDAGQISDKYAESDEVSMSNLAQIFAKSWNVKGGIMYKITKGSARYAFKQLKTDGVISSTSDPSKKVSGFECLSVFTNCSFKYGNEILTAGDVVESQDLQ